MKVSSRFTGADRNLQTLSQVAIAIKKIIYDLENSARKSSEAFVLHPLLPNKNRLGYETKKPFQSKRKLKQCKSETIASIKQMLYTAQFFRGAAPTREFKNTTKSKRKLQETRIFFVAREKKDFCFHVCFNLKLAAKQQHFHCFARTASCAWVSIDWGFSL